jgi:hypothetical protein
MEVPLLRLAVIGPVAGLAVREEETLRLVGGLVAPDVPVVVRRVGIGARLLEPRVLVGGVIRDEVDHDADATVARGPDELDELPGRAEPLVDAVVVGDVVAVVAVGRRLERHQPDTCDAQPRQVVDLPDQAVEVADAVAVGVAERLDVEAVDDRVLPPLIARLVKAHCGQYSQARFDTCVD